MKNLANCLMVFTLAMPRLCFSQEIAKESESTIQCREVVARFHSSRGRLGIEYFEELKHLDQSQQELTDDLLSDFHDSLELARKAAMQQDNLNRALAMKSLIDYYFSESDIPNIPKADKAAKKDPIELAFERKLAITKRERDLAGKSLSVKLLRRGEAVRNEALKSLETLRSSAMKADNLDEAKQIQDQITSLKKLDLSEPIHEEPAKPALKPIDNLPSAAPARVSCVVVIAPIANTSQQQTIEIPNDVSKVEASFFTNGTPETSVSRYPSYLGKLTVNSTTVVRYKRKYIWSDGQTHNTAVCMDGKEINTRLSESVKGTVDITSLTPPGKSCTITYSNNNKTPTGVRFYLYR